MTRKDYEAAATTIRGMGDRVAAADMAETMIIMFTRDNVRFSSVKFLQACGFTPPVLDKVLADFAARKGK